MNRSSFLFLLAALPVVWSAPAGADSLTLGLDGGWTNGHRGLWERHADVPQGPSLRALSLRRESPVRLLKVELRDAGLGSGRGRVSLRHLGRWAVFMEGRSWERFAQPVGSLNQGRAGTHQWTLAFERPGRVPVRTVLSRRDHVDRSGAAMGVRRTAAEVAVAAPMGEGHWLAVEVGAHHTVRHPSQPVPAQGPLGSDHLKASLSLRGRVAPWLTYRTALNFRRAALRGLGDSVEELAGSVVVSGRPAPRWTLRAQGHVSAVHNGLAVSTHAKGKERFEVAAVYRPGSDASVGVAFDTRTLDHRRVNAADRVAGLLRFTEETTRRRRFTARGSWRLGRRVTWRARWAQTRWASLPGTKVVLAGVFDQPSLLADAQREWETTLSRDGGARRWDLVLGGERKENGVRGFALREHRAGLRWQGPLGGGVDAHLGLYRQRVKGRLLPAAAIVYTPAALADTAQVLHTGRQHTHQVQAGLNRALNERWLAGWWLDLSENQDAFRSLTHGVTLTHTRGGGDILSLGVSSGFLRQSAGPSVHHAAVEARWERAW